MLALYHCDCLLSPMLNLLLLLTPDSCLLQPFWGLYVLQIGVSLAFHLFANGFEPAVDFGADGAERDLEDFGDFGQSKVFEVA